MARPFTVTIEYKARHHHRISADGPHETVRISPIPIRAPADFVRPRHVFHDDRQDGGVLMRSGHTEAAIDLCRLSNWKPVGVICELVKDDGT